MCKQAFCQSCVNRQTFTSVLNSRTNGSSSSNSGSNSSSGTTSERICVICQQICSPQVTVDDLMKLKLKHLRSILTTANVTTTTCKEKRDLVDLVLNNKCKFQHPATELTSSNNLDIQITSDSTNAPDSNNTPVTIHRIDSTVSSNSLVHQTETINETESQQEIGSNELVLQNSQITANNLGPNQFESQINTINETVSTLDSQTAQSNHLELNKTETSVLNSENGFNFNDSEAIPPPPSSPPPPTPAQHHSDQPAEAPAPIKRRASLSDIKSVSDIENLSIKQIKEILAVNFVDYKGCCEKKELIEKAKRLYNSYEDNKRLEKELNNNETNEMHNAAGSGAASDGSSASSADPHAQTGKKANVDENDLCKICMETLIDCVLLDCGHMVSCTKCGKRLAECPVCKC